jgi:hypothetical protein
LWSRNIPLGLLLLLLTIAMVILLILINWFLEPLALSVNAMPAFLVSQRWLNHFSPTILWNITHLSWLVCCTPFVAFFIVQISKGRSIRSIIWAVSLLPLLILLAAFCFSSSWKNYIQQFLLNEPWLSITSIVVVILYLCTPAFRRVVLSTFEKTPTNEDRRIPWILSRSIIPSMISFTILTVLTGLTVMTVLLFSMGICNMLIYSLACYGVYYVE